MESIMSPIMAMTGYEPKTTFWMDFSIADSFGIEGIKDTYNRAFNEWKNDYIYLTELVMVLNHKIWEWHGKNDEIAELYNDLWEKTDAFGIDNLEDEKLDYYLRTLD